MQNKEISKYYAEALKNSKLVPDIIMSGSSGNGQQSALNLVDMLTAKTAKDLALDLNTKG